MKITFIAMAPFLMIFALPGCSDAGGIDDVLNSLLVNAFLNLGS
jgi:hypothetical protein